MTSKNLASLFATGEPGPQIRQGVVEAWNTDTGENSVQIAGGTLVNLPSLTAESAELAAGDVVAVLSSGDTALVLGKVTTPGDPGTVPTWNADLTALAPLVDLAAVTVGTTVSSATLADSEVTGSVIKTAETGQRVEINGVDGPNGIAFYSGDAGETFPGVVQPTVVSTGLGIDLSSAQTAADVIGSALRLLADKVDANNSTAHLQSSGSALVSAGRTASLKVGSGGIDVDTAAGTLIRDTTVQIGTFADRVTFTGNDVTNADLSSLTNIFPAFPYYYAYLNASVAITTAGTAQKVTTWTTDGTAPSSGITYSSGNWTVPTDGRYRLRAQAWWAAVASPVGVRTAQWVKNPSTLIVSHTVPGNSATVPMPVYVEKTVRLAAGDQVFLQVIQGQANGHNLIGSTADITYAQIEWVGP